MRHAILIVALILAANATSSRCFGEDMSRSNAAVNKWYNAIATAEGLVRDSVRGRTADPTKAEDAKTQALAKFEEAMTFSPTDEHKADTLLYLAQACEAFAERAKAIETYRQLVDSYPESGHGPSAYQRLGDFYTFVTLAATSASDEEVREVERKMAPYRAIEYYEKAVAAGNPTSLPVLKSKSALIILYGEAGRKDDQWRLLDDFAKLTIESVTEGDYVGPYRDLYDGPMVTLSERIDLARRYVVMCRKGTPKLIVGYCREKDPEKTAENLRKVIEKYPGTDIAEAADAELQRVLEQIDAKAGSPAGD